MSNLTTYEYDSSYWNDFARGNLMEWVITNGTGAYAGGSLIAAKNRTHQGYLTATLHEPTNRYVVFEQIEEWLSVGGNETDLETSAHRINGETVLREGQKYLKKVSYDGTVTFEYEVPGVSLTKTISLVRGENTAVVAYTIRNSSDSAAVLVLTPQFNFREHNTLTKAEDLKFEMILTGDTLSLVPESRPDVRIDFSISEGTYYELINKIDEDYELSTEVDLETEGLCSHFSPFEISIDIDPGSTKDVSCVCTLVQGDPEKIDEERHDEAEYMELLDEFFSRATGEQFVRAGVLPESEKTPDGEWSRRRSRVMLEQAADRFVGPQTAHKFVAKAREYYAEVEAQAGYSDEFARRLCLDADHFLVNRKSTGKRTVLAGLPWFTDWGRDTMIAFTGLTLCTGRFDEAEQILQTFAMYVHHGMIPNMFPDDGSSPLYNTADASLWYFYAVYKYLEYFGKRGKEKYEEAKSFIRKEIYPVLVQILDGYEHGTDFSIFMRKDGLLHAGSDLDQITWMDVRVGDLVVTPRHGCPVEINALWYNALRIGARLAQDFGDEENRKHYEFLADRVHDIYEDKFWNEESGCLYDVVGTNSMENGESAEDINDPSIRPNQLYAVSLPYSLLSVEKEKAVVDVCLEKLYIGTGIRSLSPDHPDYHGQYRGALAKRDLSYHQGTAWGFLMGTFITAYAKVYKDAPDCHERLLKLIEPVKIHQSEANCIGGICEVFEGDDEHLGRGCYTQAWSTGEVLRAYVEDILS